MRVGLLQFDAFDCYSICIWSLVRLIPFRSEACVFLAQYWVYV